MWRTFKTTALLISWVLVLACVFASAICRADSDVEKGARIFRQGVLRSGAVLRGGRGAGMNVQGLAAACINCHRSSGLGTTEGRIVVPPITGKYLFRWPAARSTNQNVPQDAAYARSSGPYTDDTLARTLREGRAANGRTLNYLMPRY